MRDYTTDVLFRPDTESLRYLPEGPCALRNGSISWVAIQHGAASSAGSINVLNLEDRSNHSFELPGRPGFAFPTAREDVFVAGVERGLGLFDLSSGEWTPLSDEVDSQIDGTIINDGVAFESGIVFGTKDVRFEERKAGLYLWRRSDSQMIQLRDDQICSNGKVITGQGNDWTLLDIDSPTQTVVRYSLDVAEARLSEPETVIDLTGRPDFPDGMIATPDGRSVIIAFYNPEDVETGAARQYSIETGELQAEWMTVGSPRVTCPLLIEQDGRVRLVLTTAVEGMSAEQQERHPNAGCLFIGDTDFDSLSSVAVLDLS